jgi:uncharacterized protein YndB with AHSA1/START domain
MITDAEKRQAATAFEEVVQAPPTLVYRMFTSPAGLRSWLADTAEADSRVGGRLYLWWNRGYYTAGTYTDLAPGQRVGFTWRGPDDPTPAQVRVELTPEGEAGTRVAVNHEGVVSGDWQGWPDALENLKSVVETGIDLRLARRPMFGLNGADVVTAENAERFGVPEPTGLHLSSLVEGMAAQKAGIQVGDVVIALGDHPVSDFYTFTIAMQAHRAGDRVPVTVYRGGQKQVITVELGGRQMPELPTDAKEWAATLREGYERVNREMAEALEGVTEDEANWRPAPREWCARQILGHLIALEYDTQMWIGSVIEDDEVPQPLHNNVFERVAAISEAQGPLPEAVEQLRRAEQATVRLVESLPDEVMARKAEPLILAMNLATYESHTRQHIEEIKALVEQARAR